jgi:hypothetical protein
VDSLKRQTFAATPAEPGGLPCRASSLGTLAQTSIWRICDPHQPKALMSLIGALPRCWSSNAAASDPAYLVGGGILTMPTRVSDVATAQSSNTQQTFRTETTSTDYAKYV